MDTGNKITHEKVRFAHQFILVHGKNYFIKRRKPQLSRILIKYFSLLIISLLSACVSTQTQDPNVIIILADDLGFSDLGCTGSEFQTPNLDSLAANGVLFTNCYNTSRCCPTRASLLTGRYQHQVGFGHMDTDLGVPAYQGRFFDGVTILPEQLKNHGYRTMMLGKWHLGHEEDHTPLARGFDRMYGIPKGGGVYFYPCVGRDRQVFLNDRQVFPDSNWYSTDAFTDYAIEFAEEAIGEDKPFFMYLAYIAPHFPLQARREDILKYQGKYKKGYAHYRQQRFEKQKELGLISADTKLSPPDHENWDTIKNKEAEDLKMAVYAAQVDRMDQNIGRLISTLRQNGQLENTAIFFLSDNGAASTNLHQFPEAEIGSKDCWSAYGRSWANVSNTPFRKYKAMAHEGGIITPLIMHWPAGLRSNGLITRQPIHIIDLFPTILSLVSGLDEDGNLENLEGSSLMPVIRGERSGTAKTMLFEHQGNRAVRVGDWKLVSRHRQSWELYHLKDDPTELNNLAENHPDKKSELLSAYKQWANENGVEEWPIENINK